MSKGVRWLGRKVAPDGPALTLCLSEKEYLRAHRVIEGDKKPSVCWVSPGANSTVHIYGSAGAIEEMACIVCLDPPTDEITDIQIYALLVHEAVHIWQEYAEAMGEKNPGAEQEAYAIQLFSMRLMQEWYDRKEKQP